MKKRCTRPAAFKHVKGTTLLSLRAMVDFTTAWSVHNSRFRLITNKHRMVSWSQELRQQEHKGSGDIHCYHLERSWASAAVELNSSVFRVITRRKFQKRRSGTTYRSHLQGMEPTGSPETSVLKRLTPRNNPEGGRVMLPSCKTTLNLRVLRSSEMLNTGRILGVPYRKRPQQEADFCSSPLNITPLT